MSSATGNSPVAVFNGNDRPIRTGAWHGGATLDVPFPANWDVKIWWPSTPPALTDREVEESLDRPIGQPPIRDACRGRARALIIIDDLNRPTPVDRVMPIVLRHLREGGISANTVRILLSAGTHAAPHSDCVWKKVGAEAALACQILIHDAKRDCVTIGRTSSGIPVSVDKAVLASDFVMGIGGVYPNHTAGYGGGSKLALGVLGLRTIKSLHFRYRPIGWGLWQDSSPFRTDLNEIAKMIRFETMISVQINADREIIRATCGDHFLFQKDEVAFAQHYFSAPSPEEADVVISNAYPNDLSVTAAIQKGTAPLRRTRSGGSRILIASCAGGAGHHGLFPVMNQPPCLRALQIARHVSVMKPGELARAVVRRLRRGPGHRDTTVSKPIWFYRPGDQTPNVHWNIPGYRLLNSWSDVLLAVEREQGIGKQLKVFCYPCAPLQRLGL